ncbi:hypothetical protein PIB30_062097 [Stylosanthes scabra]|uniref:Uncharacterized protein n=1 Tax=Stylosanthes scabra TaxID=79078 RepID=A0ABU6QKN8_9FABA|nr:hypothetical protein [Stylosanthes scabra]
MGLFDSKMYHGAYSELRRLGYPQTNIASLWYKDPALQLHEIDRYEEPFPKCDYVDVGDKTAENNDKGVKEGANADEEKASTKGVEEGANMEGVEDGLGTKGGQDEVDSEEGSDDEDADDVHFTNSEDDYDDDTGFEEENGEKIKPRVDKGKWVAIDGLSDEQGNDSEEFDNQYETWVGNGEDDEDDLGVGSGMFLVYKRQKDMKAYRWQFGTVFACRDDFKDAIVSYAVQNSRASPSRSMIYVE